MTRRKPGLRVTSVSEADLIAAWHSHAKSLAIATMLDVSESWLYVHWNMLKRAGKLPDDNRVHTFDGGIDRQVAMPAAKQVEPGHAENAPRADKSGIADGLRRPGAGGSGESEERDDDGAVSFFAPQDGRPRIDAYADPLLGRLVAAHGSAGRPDIPPELTRGRARG